MNTDKMAAEKAGYHFVYVNWGYGYLEKVKDVWFNSIQGLVDYVILQTRLLDIFFQVD